MDKIIDRMCYVCNTIQPPYTHHCSKCKQCVAMIDHHCPWINNCVGYYTQKPFFLFNFYGILTLAYADVLLTQHLLEDFFRADNEGELDSTFSVVACSLFAIYLGLLFMLVVFCD